jgi:hypothetical protein
LATPIRHLLQWQTDRPNRSFGVHSCKLALTPGLSVDQLDQKRIRQP